jgi:hypothetical protein
VRVLLDENLPHDLIGVLVVHTVSTVQGMGWSGVENGELLRRASGETDVFVTMDRRLQHQQNIAVLPYGVVLIRAKSNRIQDLLPFVPAILAAIERSQAGQVEEVGA